MPPPWNQSEAVPAAVERGAKTLLEEPGVELGGGAAVLGARGVFKVVGAIGVGVVVRGGGG